VTFITGSDREGQEWSPEAWRKLATATGTICVFMGMRRIEVITRALIDGGRPAETPAAVVRWGARPYQRTVVGTLATLAEQVRKEGLNSPAIILVGEVVSVREILRWYDKKPLFGKRVLIPRPRHQARETARALRDRAAAPISCPAIEIGPAPDERRLREAVAASGGYDWVIFTSKNGVEAYFDQVDRMGRDSRILGGARVAVIGPKTGQALEQRSMRPDLVAR
jgi:uroporphyrinogen III methyltransferase/synthase